MHEWPTHARADSSLTMTTSRSCHAPQSRQQNFQRVADCVGVCVYVCVFVWQRRGNFNWIYATDLWYVFLRVGMRECEWDRACIYACVCLWECVESVFMRGSGMSVCGLLYATVSEQTRTHKGKGNYVASVAASASSCNTATLHLWVPHNVITYSSKSSGKWKTFHNFHIVSIFEAKRDALAPCTGLECHEN